jgi:hypothetical protein
MNSFSLRDECVAVVVCGVTHGIVESVKIYLARLKLCLEAGSLVNGHCPFIVLT